MTKNIEEKRDSLDILEVLPSEIALLVKEQAKKYLPRTEEELRKEIKPDFELNCLRTRFWEEYWLARSQARLMDLENITRGVCSPEFLISIVNTKALAWLLCPPKEFNVLLKESVTYGVAKLRNILNLPLVDEDGDVDHKSVKLVLDAYKTLERRLMGNPRSDININNVFNPGLLSEPEEVEVIEPKDVTPDDQLTLEEIDKKLEDLGENDKA